MKKFEIGDIVAVGDQKGRFKISSSITRNDQHNVTSVENGEQFIVRISSLKLTPTATLKVGDDVRKVGHRRYSKGYKIIHIHDGHAMLESNEHGIMGTAKISDLQLMPKVIECTSVELPRVVQCKPSQFDNWVLEILFESKDARDLALKNL